MNEIDTPESYSASYGTRGDLYELCRKLERERNQYKAKLDEFMALADEFAESRRGSTRFLVLADEIEEAFPELATGRFSGVDADE